MYFLAFKCLDFMNDVFGKDTVKLGERVFQFGGRWKLKYRNTVYPTAGAVAGNEVLYHNSVAALCFCSGWEWPGKSKVKGVRWLFFPGSLFSSCTNGSQSSSIEVTLINTSCKTGPQSLH